MAAKADDPSVSEAGVSNQSLEQELGRPTYQKYELTYFGEFVGSSLGSTGLAYQINPVTSKVDSTLPQVLENQIKLNYNFTDTLNINPGLIFYSTNFTLSAASTVVYIRSKLL